MKDKEKSTVAIGEIIKRELKNQGKTSVWLAEKLGCHRTNVYKIYNRNTIDSGMLFHISKLLKVDFFKYFTEALKKK
jgi:plasmid maintenance system antidote protein VapI